MTILDLVLGILVMAWIWAGSMILIFNKRLFYLRQFNDENMMKFPLEEIEVFKKKHQTGMLETPWNAIRFNKILKKALKEKE